VSDDRGFDPTRLWNSTDWSLTAGRAMGIRIRLSYLFFLYIAIILFRHGYLWGFDSVVRWALPEAVILFTIVLLHEFGHCFGCRLVGGVADDVLIWPLGGLATCEPPPEPVADLVTTIAGPLVNVGICLALFPILVMGFQADSLSLLNPFNDWWQAFHQVPPLAVGWTAISFKVSMLVLLFNLLPFFPLDGGRILMGLVWLRTDRRHATIVATTLGMIGAVLFVGVSLWTRQPMLVLIGVFGAVQCLLVRSRLEQEDVEEEGELPYDFSRGYVSFDASGPAANARRPSRLSIRQRIVRWFEMRRIEQVDREEKELDRILEKISASGRDSLSWKERRLLHRASRRRREP
jgi:Zn-dependent protease